MEKKKKYGSVCNDALSSPKVVSRLFFRNLREAALFVTLFAEC